MGVSKHTSRQQRTTTEWVSYAVVNFSNLKSPLRTETVPTWQLVMDSDQLGVSGSPRSRHLRLSLHGDPVIDDDFSDERWLSVEDSYWKNNNLFRLFQGIAALNHVVVEYVMTIEHLKRLSVAQDSYWELETKTNKAGERIKNIRCLWSPFLGRRFVGNPWIN